MARRSRFKTLLIVVFALFSIPGFASAQSTCNGASCDDEAAAAASLYSTTTTGGGITTTAVVVVGVYLTVRTADKATAMKTYLKENAVALEFEITMGGGETVDDLAFAFGIEQNRRGAFGKALRENRMRLLSLVEPKKLTNERALQFAELIQQLVHKAGLVQPS